MWQVHSGRKLHANRSVSRQLFGKAVLHRWEGNHRTFALRMERTVTPNATDGGHQSSGVARNAMSRASLNPHPLSLSRPDMAPALFGMGGCSGKALDF